MILLGQDINLNNDFNNQFIRYSILTNQLDTEFSLNIRPLNSTSFRNYWKSIQNNFK